MALQTIPGGLLIPYPPGDPNSAPSSGVLLLDAAGEIASVVFRATAAKSIRKIHFRTATVTTGAIMDIRVETVNTATGDPSGTLWAANTNVSHTIASNDDNIWLVTAALTADATVAKGDLVAVSIVNPAVSPGTLQIARLTDDDPGLFPYGDLFTTVWTKSVGSPGILAEYSDGTYESVLGFTGTPAITTLTFNSGSTPDEIGLKFQLPFPCRATGCWVWVDLDGDCTVKLYDTDGSTVLTSISHLATERNGAAADLVFLPFTGTASLLKNVFYRLTVVPTSVTSLSLYDFTVPTAGAMDAFAGGQNFHSTSRTDAGAWTDTTTTRPFMGLFLDQFDDGAGSGPVARSTILARGSPY